MNLFVVESPFQLISAIEASYAHPSSENLLIVKYRPSVSNKINNDQLDRLLKLKKWDRLIKIKHPTSYFISDIKLLSNIKKISNVDLVFIGEIRSWYMRQYCNILKNKGCYLLDDGTATITMQDIVIKNQSYYMLKSFKFKIKLLLNYLILLFFFRRFYRLNSRINLFTCFNIEKCFPGQIIEKHNFSYLKKVSSEKRILPRTAYFFGGVEDSENILPEEILFNELAKVKKYYDSNGISLIYIPHRRENAQKIRKIKKEIGCKILYFVNPAEVEFIFMHEIPEYISSFCSTALYTVSLMFDYKKKSFAFFLPLEKMSAINKKELGTLYQEYKKSMTVLNLEKIAND